MFTPLDGLLLYVVIAAFAVLELISMEQDKPGICTGLLIAALIVLQYCSTLQPLSFVYHYPVQMLIIVGVYFAIGSAWIIIKWFSHVYKMRDQFNRIKPDCINELKRVDHDFDPNRLTDQGKQRIYRLAAQKLGVQILPLQVSQHKAQMYMWWLCWPVSLFWTVLNDPITRLWNFVYNTFGSWMQHISDRSIDLK